MDQKISRWAKMDGTILLLGETGTGKSYMAKKIHEFSDRAEEPFITAHLASLSSTLLESELFGHMKGAFTDAQSDKIGYLSAVKKGTIFLDEIGELSIDSQKKLLFLLEEKQYIPVGSTTSRSFSGRIIVATNKNLLEEVNSGRFRKDLYYRLMMFTYLLPSLRDDSVKKNRLWRTVWAETKVRFNCRNVMLTDELREFLLDKYLWPGNIRELRNVAEYFISSGKDELDLTDLPSWISLKRDTATKQIHPLEINNYPDDYHQAVEAFESQYLLYQLKKFQGRVNHTARMLQISKSTLIAKIRKYGINIWQIKADLQRANRQLVGVFG